VPDDTRINQLAEHDIVQVSIRLRRRLNGHLWVGQFEPHGVGLGREPHAPMQDVHDEPTAVRGPVDRGVNPAAHRRRAARCRFLPHVGRRRRASEGGSMVTYRFPPTDNTA
jgi:hypothetical protein